MRAAGGDASSVLSSAPTSAASPAGQPTSGTVLDNANRPPGTTVTVTGFSVAGSSEVFLASATPVNIVDPSDGSVAGALSLKSDGAYTFTPAPGEVGSAPAINVFLKSSDGQTATSSLTLNVLPCAYALLLACGVQSGRTVWQGRDEREDGHGDAGKALH